MLARLISPGMTSEWTVVLPQNVGFEGASTQLFAVNGQPVSSQDSLNDALHSAFGQVAVSTLTLELLVGADEASAQPEAWLLDVVQRTELPNGIVFQTASEEGAWVTRLAEKPRGLASDLAVGDALLGHLATGRMIDGRTTLPEIAEAAAAGETTMNFAVKKRDGNTWMATLPLAPAASN